MKVYQGMIVGIHTRDNDLEVNVLKGKKLTNIRTTSKDEAVRLTPPIQMTLERSLAWIQDDELVEVTPKSIRLRKADPRPERAQALREVEGGLSPRTWPPRSRVMLRKSREAVPRSTHDRLRGSRRGCAAPRFAAVDEMERRCVDCPDGPRARGRRRPAPRPTAAPS